VKGVQFRNHEIIGDIVPLAKRYADEGADELVFYDITASSDGRVVDKSWVSRVAEVIDIPFCVRAGLSRTTRRRSSPSAPIRFRSTPGAGRPDADHPSGRSLWRAVYCGGH
jgi:hypothetical protein